MTGRIECNGPAGSVESIAFLPKRSSRLETLLNSEQDGGCRSLRGRTTHDQIDACVAVKVGRAGESHIRSNFTSDVLHGGFSFHGISIELDVALWRPNFHCFYPPCIVTLHPNQQLIVERNNLSELFPDELLVLL